MLTHRQITKRSNARLQLAKALQIHLEKRLPVINKDTLTHIVADAINEVDIYEKGLYGDR